MASLIPCPHCGQRPKEEFTVKGAALARPAADASLEVWFDYVYLRDNPRGRYDEHWHHTSGCRRWLIVTRNTATHEIEDTCDSAAREETGQ
ncbi:MULTISPECIES: sarcosine oxidase subunit delta [unclassified Bradyrhizobium]|uniref:sarcosine oxidase subunit delta n=1 Tax=unclassified Bradyrhizobium TaxID=2631580 RepID=UPI00247B2CF5|nr:MULTISPECIES: sarcosine oxidase subunit delta [unclassified Bradyrhizobium]WGR72915.1 sarcosine oxidase subunit delta [Bradyrhizobium sp. ISRA426]WGR77750.1 sarcosine oxidase subunit delta [Bradyrhizobium sp. ISRA430]WGR88155.1 sarcosine oxidase subunit delta [Bradyrhizobium sp. ISRA432]